VARRRFPGQAGRGPVRRHLCPGRHHPGLAGLLAWRDGTGGSFGIVFSVGVFVLNAALASLGMVLYYRKIARASQAAAGNAGTGEQQGQPTR
jgi:hypothetical protein